MSEQFPLAPAHRLQVYLPVPHVDHHVVLVAHADNVFPIGRKRHTGHSIFMLLQLCDLSVLRHLPDPNRWHVTALRETEREIKNMRIVFRKTQPCVL